MHATMTDRTRVVSPCQAEFRASLLRFGHRQINSRLNSQLQLSLEYFHDASGCFVTVVRWSRGRAARAGLFRRAEKPEPSRSSEKVRRSMAALATAAGACGQ